ncbi:unnamed protein product [Oreochromis niloticus]|nr:unnamed protein product [Mustela putorius furo]
MQKKIAPYLGKISVAFRKGPLGYLPRDSSKEARRIKNVPKLQDKSAPVREDDALTVIYQRGGDASDMKEVQGEYILQFGKYKGKSFQWLLENECRVHHVPDQRSPEARGCRDLCGRRTWQGELAFICTVCPQLYKDKNSSELRGQQTKSTWKEIWGGRGDGYGDFITRKSCSQGTRMHKLQQYVRKKQQSVSASTNAPTKPLGMDEDKDLEDAMLSISPVKLHMQSFTVPAAAEGSTPRGSSGANTGFQMKGFRTGVK